ncbi:unnamed protein product [Pseudo-nitzschia multistriata]|uniref:Uncharacterized protein n=1 Tax=Pseudo-nitzschia multistriata TaxID=183589 RepID=A0A448ZBQ5_9STRA|nr:unnamed protein product [Pseudo-nitzschia multistriata]
MMRSSVTTTTMRRLEGAFRRQLNGSLSATSICAHHPQRGFSSARPKAKESRVAADPSGGDTEPSEKTQNRQPFVKPILEPGEWDIDRKDPYHRPKPPRNKLISAEDFANRPPVGFDNEFSSYEDSMIALSWLDTKTCRQIYSTYVDMMVRHQTDHPGRTSHEYVCRVLAQRFQITTWRAAGVVQLQHAEEQMRRNNPELLCEEQAQWAEETIMKNISDAYKSERSHPPNRGHGGQHQPFVEDPVGIHGLGEPDEISTSWAPTDDIYDLEAKLHQANARDDELAQVMIDEHVYSEDVDESTLPVQTDGVAKGLIRAHKKQQNESKNEDESLSIAYPETNGQGAKRPRWKYVAKVVNTRAMRKKGRKITSYSNNNTTNTLVEHNGELRVATVEEAKKVAWKPTRTKGNSYIYEGAQKAWLDKTINGKTEVWGKAPKTSAAAATAAAAAGVVTEEPVTPTDEASAAEDETKEEESGDDTEEQDDSEK